MSSEHSDTDSGDTDSSDTDSGNKGSGDNGSDPGGEGAGRSVLDFIARKTGEARRVTLREEDSASVSAPLIDPRSQEKLAVPQGRGNYQFMGEIARGGMGVILKGHDTDLGRDVAVKVLHKRLCERMDVVQRFVEEAQIGGQLQHPGIVPVYELGLMADERPYFSMKLVKGRTLATILAEREDAGSNRRGLIDIFESVCQTLAYAHSRGVIHRDLKPANIMVGAFGEVQVVDWGLAKVLLRGGTADEKRAQQKHAEHTVLETVRSDGSGSGTDSMVGSILGTPAYMPPEQASGLVDRLDERADVFALGAILCEILTGLPPYVGERDEVISAAAQAECEPALERIEACQADPELKKLVKHCLMAASAARPANAGIVAERVHRHIESVEERAHQAQVAAAEASVRAAEERKARKLTLALGAAVVAVVAVGAGGWLWVQKERSAQERTEAEREQAVARRDRELTGEVNASLQIAATLQGAERWEEAIDEARRAHALAEGGGASDALLAGVDATLAELRERKAEVDRSAEQALDTERLMDALRDIERPTGLSGSAEPVTAYRDAFLAHGVDLDAGEIDDAARLLTERGLGSDVALVLDSWSEARRQEEDEDGALRLLELAHAVDPDPERAHLREALANRDLEELEYLAESVLEEQPPSTIALLSAGLRKLGARESALRVYRTGVDLHPDDFGLASALGRFLEPGLGPAVPDEQLHEALRYHRAALALNPESLSARDSVAGLLIQLGQFARAAEHFEMIIARKPEDASLVFGLARTYMLQGRFDAAIELCEPLVEDTTWIGCWALNNIAVMKLEQGDAEGALETARRSWAAALNTDPGTHAGLLTVFAKACVALDSEEPMIEARRLYDEGISPSPFGNYRLAWFTLDFVRYGEDRRALHVTQTASTLKPPAGARVAGLLVAHAVELAERAVAGEPGSPLFRHMLGCALFHAGEHERALAALKESERLAPGEEIENWLYLAMAHNALGQEDAASEWYERAAARMDANPSTQHALRVRAEARFLLGARR